MRNSLFFGAALVLSLGTFACGSTAPDDLGQSESEESAARAASGTVTIKATANGKTIRLKAGQKVQIRLQSNSSTGYRWLPESYPLGEPTLSEETTSGRPSVGGPSTQVFTFDTTAKVGTFKLDFILTRPWNQPVSAADRFAVTLKIAQGDALPGTPGGLCGTIGGFLCKDGQSCKFESRVRDAAGVCPPAIQPPAATTCKRTGCSSTICVNSNSPDVITTCQYRAEYACYASAQCAVQSDGECGWTLTDSFRDCQKKALSGPAIPVRP